MKTTTTVPPLHEAIRAAFGNDTTPSDLRDLGRRMKAAGGFAGRLRPWAWFGEITRGCNLRCGFCTCRTKTYGDYEFLTEETWRSLLSIIKAVSPRTRLEIGNAGEPTLHPLLPDLLRIARETVPNLQILIYTNGTTLMSGQRTYAQLFEAGLNILYVNLYYPPQQHFRLAEESGYRWVYEGQQVKKDAGWLERAGSLGLDENPEVVADAPFVSPFEYRAGKNPNDRLINFCRNPGYWTAARRHRHGFSTLYNKLDWEASAKYGLEPITEPLKRRCDFPQKFPSFEYTGRYTLCCWDFTGETAGTFGTVHDGVPGFLRYWFGPYMQKTRQLLDAKDRASHPVCSRCGTVSHRGDIPYWQREWSDEYWTGSEWKPVAEMPAPFDRQGDALVSVIRKHKSNWRTLIPVVGAPASAETLAAETLHPSAELGAEAAAAWNQSRAAVEPDVPDAEPESV